MAESDLAEAKAWYEAQRAGLGGDFLDRVDQVFEAIRRMPELHREVAPGMRRALVRQLPYAVIYRIDDDQINVIAVYHTRRDPRVWRGRA